jgi:Phage terminase large subunit/Terminase RNaseH-like domain
VSKGRVLRIPTAPIFEPLLKPARYKGAHGGRGSAKSYFYADSAIERCVQYPGTRIVCVREVQRSLKESVKRLIEDKIIGLELGSKFNVLNDAIGTPGGGVIVFQGMQDHTAESIKSLEGFDVAYVEEAQTLTARSLEMLRPTIRKPGSELWFGWNPRHATDPVDELLRGKIIPPDAIVVKTSYKNNPWFPAELEVERRFDYKNNPHRYAHIWEGEYEPQAIGAIWDRATINRNRRDEAPAMSRILVSVDPPISSDPRSDYAGIIVGGLGNDNHGYVLADYSAQGTPKEWAERAIDAYDLHEADAIVAETNQGGEMVANTIHSIRPGLKVIEVKATRGKHIRAEPISALYGLDRIHHVGAFPELEQQMCLMTADGYQGEGSPDRVDSLVWLFTELFPKMTRRERPLNQSLPTRTNSKYRAHRLYG